MKRPFRGTGLTERLLRAAADHARKEGANVIEGYPFDTAGITSTHRGHSKVFRRVGFRRRGRRWSLRLR